MTSKGQGKGRESGLRDSRSQRPWQGAGPPFRYSPDSFATIPVSKGSLPDLVLARFVIVLENGQADPGTGHTPTGAAGRNRFSNASNMSKFRLETQESVYRPPAESASGTKLRRRKKMAAAKDTMTLCI